MPAPRAPLRYMVPAMAPKVPVPVDRLAELEPIVRAAIQDPEGARVYLMSLGEMLDYPPGELSPIPCNRGRESWQANLERAQPYWLGLAAARIERRWEQTRIGAQLGEFHGARNDAKESGASQPESAEAPAAKAESAQEPKGEDKVAIVKPSAAGAMFQDGYYSAVITEITESVYHGTNRQTGKPEDVDQFTVQFVILDADGKRTTDEIRGYVRQAWSQRSNLFKWASAILGRRCPKPEDDFDTDALLNKKCDIQIVNQTSQKGAEYSKVASVFGYQSMTSEPEEEEAFPVDEPVAAGSKR